MDVTRLSAGERAPDDGDRIHIHTLPSGKVSFTGSVVIHAEPPSKPHVVRIDTMGIFDSPAAALQAGAAWAKERGATFLYVETDQ